MITTSKGMKPTKIKNRLPYFFTLPVTLAVFALLIYPTVFVFYLSFHSSLGGIDNLEFVGLKNFLFMFQSPTFWVTLKNTLLFTLGAVTIPFLVGLLIAYLLHIIQKGVAFFRVIFILPLAVAPVVTALTWNMILNPLYGVANYFLKLMHIPGLQWAAHSSTALMSVILIEAWQWVPFMILILYAGFQMIPEEPLEAAMIDGASGWQGFIYITLPLLKSTIIIAIIFRLMDAFKSFDIIYSVTKGGPAYATYTMVIGAYQESFPFHSLEKGAVLGIVMLIIAFVGSKQALKYLPK